MCKQNHAFLSRFQSMCIFCTILIMSGCTSFQTPKTVNVPVIVPCISSNVAKPDYTFDASKGKSLGEQVRSLLVDRQLAIGYTAELEAQVEGCR
jgi:hypothetical protein